MKKYFLRPWHCCLLFLLLWPYQNSASPAHYLTYHPANGGGTGSISVHVRLNLMNDVIGDTGLLKTRFTYSQDGGQSFSMDTRDNGYVDFRIVNNQIMVPNSKIGLGTVLPTFALLTSHVSIVPDGIIYKPLPDGSWKAVGTITGSGICTFVDKFGHPGFTSGGPFLFDVKVSVNSDACNDACTTGCNTQPGDQSSGLDSVNVSFALGKTEAGRFAGSLNLSSEDIVPSVTMPAALKAHVNPEFQVINQSGAIRQIKGPQSLVDVVTTTNQYRYDIFFYSLTNLAGFTNGLYAVTNGTHYKQVRIENPDDASSTNRLFVSEIESGVTNLTTFARTNLNATNTFWVHSTDNGFFKESLSVITDNGIGAWTRRSEVRSVYQPLTEAAAYQEECVYTNISGAEFLHEKIIDPDGARLITSYEYYPPGSAVGRERKLKQIRHPNGSWERYDYASDSRVTTNTVGVLNNAISSGDIENRSTVTTYSSSAPHETIVEKLMGVEVSRKYRVFVSNTNIHEYQCLTTNALYTDSNNLVTKTAVYPIGTAFQFLTYKVEHLDGTFDFYGYSTNSTSMTTIVTNGRPNLTFSAVIEGTRTITVKGTTGQMISNIVQTITNGAVGVTLSSESYSYDANDLFFQSPTITYLDGTTTVYNHGCCTLNSMTDRSGATTTYQYDPLKRRIAETSPFGIIFTNALDIRGNVMRSARIGSDSSEIVLGRTVYDLAGRVMFTTNGFGGATSITNNYSTGPLIVTNTYPNGGTRIESYYADGSMERVTGTAVSPIRYEYGITNDGGNSREFKKQIKLLENGSDSNESTLTLFDMLKRPYKVLHSSGKIEESTYNTKGQLTQQVAGGVTNVYSYNAFGEVEYSGVDMDGGGLSLTGQDRVTRQTNDVVYSSALGGYAKRSRTEQWKTFNNSTAVITNTNEISIDGLKSLNAAFGLTSVTVTGLPIVGAQVSTNTAPDGSFTVASNYLGRSISVKRYSATGEQLGGTVFEYDAHGRRDEIIDLRNGATSYVFTNSDLVATVTTPTVGGIAQTTQYFYDNAEQKIQTIQPDGASAYFAYGANGALQQTWGTRTYPVGYAYDAQGRMRYMTNWSNFDLLSGARVTEWRYDSYSGMLTNKLDDLGNGSEYTFNPQEQMVLRKSARQVFSTNFYNPAGDLIGITYSDETPDVTITFDRLGRSATVTNGVNVIDREFNDAGLQVSEAYTGGPLDGHSVTNGYDSLLRRDALALAAHPSTLIAFGYDGASRLTNVVNDTQSVGYGYLANSHLVKTTQFKQSGAARMTTSRSHDYLNRLSSISSTPSASGAVSFAYLYNTANQRTRATMADGSYWSYGYDTLGQVTSGKRYWSDDTPVAGQQFEYDFDSIGNRTETAVGGNGAGTNLRTAIYQANTLNQLTSRQVPGYLNIVGLADDRSEVRVNDLAAYRRGEYYWKELSIDNSTTAVYLGVTNQAIAGGLTNTVTGNAYLPKEPEVFLYDADGNLTNDGRWTFKWDAENRLTNMVSFTSAPVGSKRFLDFTYDYRGRRIQKVVSTNNGSIYITQYTRKFIYDGWNLIAELDGSNNLLHSYVWGTDLSGSMQGAGGVGGLLSMTVHSGATAGTYFYSYDGNGNVVALVNATTGDIAARYEYGPFGELIRATGAMAFANPFRFSTKYTDNETDLVYYGYRFYNSATGRWLSRDPIEEQGGLNLYCFVGNDSLSRTDYLGESRNAPPSSIIGGGMGGITIIPYDISKPFHWHHPISYLSKKINFNDHSLIRRACMNLMSEQRLVAIQGHMGPHDIEYHSEVMRRLNAAEKALPANASQELCRQTVNQVVDSIVEDITTGRLAPNAGRPIAIIPDDVAAEIRPDRYGYVKRIEAAKKVQNSVGRMSVYINIFDVIKFVILINNHPSGHITVDPMTGDYYSPDSRRWHNGNTGRPLPFDDDHPANGLPPMI